MKIKELQIKGLHNKPGSLHCHFNDDLNILTGSNGVGKTTILKTVWYIISGNVERLLQEIHFEALLLRTDRFQFMITTSSTKSNKTLFDVSLFQPENQEVITKQVPIDRLQLVNEINKHLITLSKSSVFFPTFRRIEGGFSISGKKRGLIHSHQSIDFGIRDIEEALKHVSDTLSVHEHKFVASISTQDVQNIIVDLISAANEKSDHLSKEMISKVLSLTEMPNNRSEEDIVADFLSATETLNLIQDSVGYFKSERETAFKLIDDLTHRVQTIFGHSGISFGEFTLGEEADAIDSDSLSSGEKQMLSFLCYNMVKKECPFFIDEPELSLHVDWQRILINVLKNQNNDNQYFIATHSPFIYTQYEDKELIVNECSHV